MGPHFSIQREEEGRTPAASLWPLTSLTKVCWATGRPQATPSCREARQWVLAVVFDTPDKTKFLASEKKVRMNTGLAASKVHAVLCS